MAIIYSYPQGTPTLLDNVIGSQIDPTTEENKTVQFTIGSIATLIGSGSGGSGTVISVATSNGTFVNVTGGTITGTGTITGDLSATGLGSPTSNYFLRGDNTWAIPTGSGSVTTISSSIAGNAFDVAITNPTTTPALGFTWAGDATEYINGAGDKVLLSTLPQGTTTANNVQLFTNKSGNISQWVNDSGYVTSSGGSGSVTTVSSSITNGDAFDVAITNPSTTPDLQFTWAGSSAQYITGQGNVATFPTIPTVNNGELAINTGTGLSGTGTFTANQSNNSTVLFGLDLTEITLGPGIDSITTGLSLDLSEFTDMTATMLTTDEFIVLDNGAQGRKAAGEIGLSIFNNDAGFITTGDLPTVNNATITVTTGTGLDGSPASFTTNQSSNETIALSLNLTEISLGLGLDSTATGLSLDLSELTDMTAAMLGTDEFIVLDAGAERRKAANEIGLSIFDNDIGFVINEPAITTNGSAPSLASGISEQSVRGLIKAQFDVGLLQDTVTVTAAQLNSLSTTPVVLIASPGINKYIKVVEASFYYLVGTTIHTFADDVDAQINSINQFVFQNSLQPTFGRTTQVKSMQILKSSTGIAADTRLVLTTDAASSTAGDGTLKVKIMYQILDTTAF